MQGPMKHFFLSLFVFFILNATYGQKKIKLTSKYIAKTISFKEGVWITYCTCRTNFDSLNYILPECFKKGALTKVYDDVIVINYDTIPTKELTYLGKRSRIYPVQVQDGNSRSWKINIIDR
jgi:hypothetical protein